jgi:hypothetical protein
MGEAPFEQVYQEWQQKVLEVIGPHLTPEQIGGFTRTALADIAVVVLDRARVHADLIHSEETEALMLLLDSVPYGEYAKAIACKLSEAELHRAHRQLAFLTDLCLEYQAAAAQE